MHTSNFRSRSPTKEWAQADVFSTTPLKAQTKGKSRSKNPRHDHRPASGRKQFPFDAVLTPAQPQASTGSSWSASSCHPCGCGCLLWRWWRILRPLQTWFRPSGLSSRHCFNPDTGPVVPSNMAGKHRQYLLPGGASLRQQGGHFEQNLHIDWHMWSEQPIIHTHGIVAPDPCQDTLLLPLLVAENTCRVMLYHARALGPNFRPSRLWSRGGRRKKEATSCAAAKPCGTFSLCSSQAHPILHFIRYA